MLHPALVYPGYTTLSCHSLYDTYATLQTTFKFVIPAGSATARPKRYMPFAEGPRSCVGQSLAKMSLAATIATLLQTFTFRLADEASHNTSARLHRIGIHMSGSVT